MWYNADIMKRAAITFFALGILVLLVSGLYINISMVVKSNSLMSEPIVSSEVLEEVNELRVKASLPELVADETLISTASSKNTDMVENNYYDHEFNGVAKYKEIMGVKSECKIIGENLAQTNESLDMIISEWLKSESHRSNMLNPDYKYTGISVTLANRGDTKVYQVVQHFCGL
jgi:uncharacterized protein YkwD